MKIRDWASVPAYQRLLDTRHVAHESELRAMIEDIPLRPGGFLLDVPCGDGFFTAMLARHAGPDAMVVGTDLSGGLLLRARAMASSTTGSRVKLIAADAAALPFPDECFDNVLSAHSLVTLMEPRDVLVELRRVVRGGGLLAILENDNLHQMLLPWPADLELALQRAEWEAFRRDRRQHAKPYVGRRLSELAREAGWKPLARKTYAIDRQAPLTAEDRRFLCLYLESLGDRAGPFLDDDSRREFDALVDPESARFLPDHPHLEMAWLDVLMLAEKA